MVVWKEPTDVATTEDIGAQPLFPAFSGVIDGVTVKVGNRVLVKDQLTSTENGYYEVVAGIGTLTLKATGEIINAEDVIRVSQGDRNAHTTWALIDATKRTFVRQDVKNYSFNSIMALKQFWQALPDATASVAGYYERGDKGGGDFTLIGVPASAQVASASPESKSITTLTEVAGLITITTPGHGLGAANNVTATYISGVTGLANRAYSVAVVDDDTFTINAKISGVSFAAGASVQYVRLVTTAEHGRSSDQRISVSGVVNTGSAVDIRGVTDLCGVIDNKTLSIPIATSGGTYTPGSNAVIGDDGLTVPATDPTGVSGGLWQRLGADHIDVKWFGAIADWGDPIAGKGTDNLWAFNAALAAMADSHNKNKKLIANGHFYLSDTLHLHRSIVFEGAGWSAATVGGTRSAPGTWLVFPRDVNGIQLHTGLEPQGGADYSTLHNLTIWCNHERALLEVEVEGKSHFLPPPPDEGQTGSGVWINCSYVYLDHVGVVNFGEHGILVDAGHGGHPGNAGGFQLTKCIAEGCGGNGIHIRGGDATVGLVMGCSSVINYGWGFFDETPAGTTYVTCHGEGNLHLIEGVLVERDYKADNGSNSSLFIGCYTESGANELGHLVTAIGGGLSTPQGNVGSAFLLGPGGAVSGQPLTYLNSSGPVETLIEFGQRFKDIGVNGGVLNLSLPGRDYNMLRYDETLGWWGLDNSSPGGRTSIRFPTTIAGPRRAAPLFSQGIFYGTPRVLGPGASAALTNHVAGIGIPTSDTWEKGDIVWNSAPTPGGPIGWICTTAGTNGTLKCVTGAIDTLIDPTKLVVNDTTDLVQWQYITVAGVIYQILNDPVHPLETLTLAIDPAAKADVGPEAPVAFSPAVFSTFGVVENIGISTSYADNQELGLADRYVTVTISGKTMALPASPIDGQTHNIKSQAGVTTTVDGNGNTIDGAATATIEATGNASFRYSTATGEWEIR